jgi:WhiB family redox-sensing transcriptional regulator
VNEVTTSSRAIPKGATVALTLTSDVSDHAAEWRDRAACRSTDPDLFFPIGTTGPAISQIESAKAVCRTCPSLDPCLEFALATNQDSGVWGATSEEERRKLRRQWLARRRQAATA